MPDRPLLTIAIPTWNRPSELHRCVELLVNQSNQNFCLLVLDNASENPASVVLQDLLPRLGDGRATVVRNCVNIGGDANILRCFEMCETEYVWVLGDDDEPLPDAVATILSTIAEHPGVLFLNFACEIYDRKTEAEAHTLDQFIEAMDSYSAILFLSTSVFRREALASELHQAYHLISSMAPHLIMLFYALSKKPALCLLMRRRIVHWELPPEGIRWSPVKLMLGVGLLMDLPLASQSRRRLAHLAANPRDLEYAAVQLMAYIRDTGDFAGGSHLMEQIYCRLLARSGRRGLLPRYLLYRHLLLRFPEAGVAVFQYIIEKTGRGKAALHFRSPF